MIRPITCITMLLAVGSGLYLYQTKHRSQLLDREIVHTLKETEAVRARIGVLRGEWALLNEPERLAELSHQHLGLQTLTPSQFVSMADLGTRLPPPGSAAPPSDVPAAEAVVSEATAPASKPPPPPARQVAAVATPKPLAEPRATGRTPSKSNAPAPTESAHAPRVATPVMTASAVPPSPRRLAPSVIGGGGGERRRLPSPEPKVAMLQASAYAAPAPVIVSALGGAYRALPPPVPFGGNAAQQGGR